MAIAFDASSAGTSGTNSIFSWSHTCSGSDRILLVWLSYASARSVSSITYNGVAMSLLRTFTSGFGEDNDLYYLVAPATGSNTVSVTLDNSTNTFASVSISYTGVKQTGVPDAQTDSSQAAAQAFAASLTTVANNCWLIAATECGGGNLGAGASTTFRVRNATFTGVGFLDSNAPKASGSNTLNGTYSGGFDSTAYWTIISLEPAPEAKLPFPFNINQAITRASFY